MLILHVSDTHLGAAPNGLISRARDVYEVFKETVEIALKERVNLYIHTGDFFHTYTPPPEAYVNAYKRLKELKEKNIKIVVIAGQHDTPKKQSLSPLQLLKDLGYIDILAVTDVVNEEISLGNEKLSVVCVPYLAREKIESVSPSRETKSILMAHLLLKEIGIPSTETQISIAMIPSGFNYIALGDYHVKTIFKHKNGAPIVYPGATEIHKVNEYGEKYVALIDLSKDEAYVNFIELQNVRPWIVLQCFDAMNCINTVLENSKTFLSKKRKKPLVYLYIDEKIKTEVISRYLDDMIFKGYVEHYRLALKQEKTSEDENNEETHLEHLEHIDKMKILIEIVREEILARQLLEFIENPDRYSANQLVEFLKNNIDITRKLESRFKKLSRQESLKQSQGLITSI